MFLSASKGMFYHIASVSIRYFLFKAYRITNVKFKYSQVFIIVGDTKKNQLYNSLKIFQSNEIITRSHNY